jgi:dUTP pyrophosphatase
MNKIGFVRLTETAKLPLRGSELSSGFDFYADNFKIMYDGSVKYENISGKDKIKLEPHARLLVGTGLAANLSKNIEIQIRPRSGYSLKYGISVVNTPGTIDTDYKDEIGIILINTSSTTVTIELGERVAQGIVAHVYTVDPVWHEVLVGEDRGGGFGSTGEK